MSTAETLGTVADALAQLASWRTDEEARQKAELVEVDQELQNLRSALDNLQNQIGALEKFRSELISRDGGVEQQEVEKGYDAIFQILELQASKMGQRAAQVMEAEQARSDATLESIAKSDAAGQFEEYRQYKLSVEPTLASLPESYRSVIAQHHSQLANRLREHVARLLTGPVDLDVEPLEIEVVYGVDAPDGAPELFIAVLPLADEVHTAWIERTEDLQTQLAARVIQAIYQAVAEAGPKGAQAMCGGHQGLLAIEADLVGGGVVGGGADVGAALAKHLRNVLASAPELAAAKVTVRLREVPVDYLLPPEEDQDEPVTEATHA